MSSTPIRHSYQQFKDSVNQFIFFSPLTLGETGRAVKINKALFLPFFCAVDPATYDGQTIVRQIENLRATSSLTLQETGSDYANDPRQTAPHKSRINKLKGLSKQTLAVKNLQVSYRVSQEAGDRSPTIYIDEIRTTNRAENEQPGLYEGSSSAGNTAANKKKNSTLDAKNVYINGAQPSLVAAMKSAQQTLNQTTPILFYNPSSATSDLNLWAPTAKSHATTAAIENLAGVLNDNKSHTVTWHIEGEGASLLTEALGKVSGELNKHEFRFINPIANTVKLLEVVNKRKATLTDKSFTYQNNHASLLSLFADKERVKTATGKLVDSKHKNYDAIKRNLIAKHLEVSMPMNSPTQIGQLNSAGQTFVQVLAKAGVYRQ